MKNADRDSVSSAGGDAHSVGAERTSLRSVLDKAERQEILKALDETNWVVAGPHGAAVRLGMKRSTLQFRMRKLGISRPTQHR
jgi:transcriptional regulator with GAF, ATPase, and Fis domain